jgi:hypothetical protein
LGVASLRCILEHHLAALLTVSCFGFFSSAFRQVMEGSRCREVSCLVPPVTTSHLHL